MDRATEAKFAGDQSNSLSGKWLNVGLLSLAELLAMVLWFSASAVIPQLTSEWQLDASGQSWLTMSVQLGFVLGALMSAALNLADRVSSRILIAVSTLAGALFNAAIPFFDAGPSLTMLLRLATGIAMAGVYPPGMKLVASWCRKDRGLGIGILVGALSVGSALPHLLNAVPILGSAGMPPWRPVLWGASGLALAGTVIMLLFVREGPYTTPSPPFDWRFAAKALTYMPSRLANFGYLGHMWELYAMWTWVPIFLLASFGEADMDPRAARLAGFSTVAIGLFGCILAGRLADRLGRTTVTIWSLAISGTCAVAAGFLFEYPILLTALCLVWGFAAVADSAQFSAAVSELTDPRYMGTALTVQTSLGFLLTMVTIRVIPPIVEQTGWQYVFMILALGPIFGIWSMWKLRKMPEAKAMASGNR